MRAREILEKCYSRVAVGLGHGISLNVIMNHDIPEALSSLSSMLNDIIDRCLVENDSDTHIIAKDLRAEVLKLLKGE